MVGPDGVDVQQAEHLVGVGVGHRVAAARDAGVVHEDVEPAELGDDRRHHGFVGLGVVDRRLDGDGPPPEGLDLGHDGSRVVGAAPVVHRHVGAVGRQPEADRGADAPPSAGDERDATFQTSHGRRSNSPADVAPEARP